MISIPVSFLLAAAFLGLAVAAIAWRPLPMISRTLFGLLLALLALEAGLVGLRFAFGVTELLAVQRLLPVWIAPLVFLAFAVLIAGRERATRLILVNGVAAVAVSVAMYAPVPVSVAMYAPVPVFWYVDALIAASYAVYGLLLLRIWLGGPDRFSEAPTALTGLLHKLLLTAILVMAASLATDALIALLFAQQRVEAAAKLISYASLVFLVTALALTLGVLRLRSAQNGGAAAAPDTPGQEAAVLVAAARAVLVEQGFFRDPALTLTRLARRVGVPDRDLSRAVNAHEGVNVSQFVNRVRLEEAARLLSTSEAPVAKIQEDVGFLTRSNFYREFQRHFGEAPGTYRKKAHSSPLPAVSVAASSGTIDRKTSAKPASNS
ncbi:helix-turn-helix transcriptional regulator [Roseibium sp. M-1]